MITSESKGSYKILKKWQSLGKLPKGGGGVVDFYSGFPNSKKTKGGQLDKFVKFPDYFLGG